jgi:hypothetical protein
VGEDGRQGGRWRRRRRLHGEAGGKVLRRRSPMRFETEQVAPAAPKLDWSGRDRECGQVTRHCLSLVCARIANQNSSVANKPFQ